MKHYYTVKVGDKYLKEQLVTHAELVTERSKCFVFRNRSTAEVFRASLILKGYAAKIVKVKT